MHYLVTKLVWKAAKMGTEVIMKRYERAIPTILFVT
jgi:hypothetical protein